MKMWRKILYSTMFASMGVLMIGATVELFSDLSKSGFLNWLETMMGAAYIILHGIYLAFSKGEWAQNHPRGARIADACGWIGIVLLGVWIWMRWAV